MNVSKIKTIVSGKKKRRGILLCTIIVGVVFLHGKYLNVSEFHFYYLDEAFHALTGIFFSDFLADMPFTNISGWTETHYNKYPALGIFIWPPLYHLVQGATILLFGVSVMVTKMVTIGFLIILLVFFYKLVRLTHASEEIALAAVAFSALSPIIFHYSHYAMLEIPVLTLCIVSQYYFLKYLNDENAKHVFISALAAALAALTKITAIYIVPFFIITAVLNRKTWIFRKFEMFFASLLCLIVIAPYYIMSFYYYGSLMLDNAIRGVESYTPITLNNFIFYPMVLRHQLGKLFLVSSLVGILMTMLKPQARKNNLYYLIWIVSCYIVFTPLAELKSRHTIYYIPAFAFFASWGYYSIAKALKNKKAVSICFFVMSFLLVSLLIYRNMKGPVLFVNGYEKAAEYVIEQSKEKPIFLFEGSFHSNFIFFIRKHDPQRQCRVLTGYRLLAVWQREKGKKQANDDLSDEDIIASIESYGPQYIIIEKRKWPSLPYPNDDFCRTVESYPQRYRLEKCITLESYPELDPKNELWIYRNISLKEVKHKTIEFKIDFLIEDLMGIDFRKSN